jgi:NodT family efflux transporter outer membrane factor (OMF) lipoprotein
MKAMAMRAEKQAGGARRMGAVRPRRSKARVSRAALAAALGAALMAGGCITIPCVDLETSPLPTEWRDAPVADAGAGDAQLIDWWQGFDDPVLNRLVADGLDTGPSVQLALLRLKEARALSFASIARVLPQFTAFGSGQYSRAIEGPELASVTGGTQTEQATASYGAQVSWEVPFFEAPGVGVGAAANSRLALADARGAKVAIAADIAQAYVDLRSAQNSSRALAESVAAADRLAGILDISVGAGFASAADAADARRQAESQRARLANFAIEERRAESVLAVLRGRAPGADDVSIAHALGEVSAVPSLPIETAPGAPADLVRLRPDVAAAEARALIAAAQLGLARADFLPRLNLTGAITVTDNVEGNPIGLGFTRATAQPLISMPLFDWGQRIAVARQRNAQLEQSLLSYRQTVNSAVAEATGALTALDQGARALTAARLAEDAALETLRGRRAAYDAGLLSLADLLRAEQQAIDARLTRIGAQAAQARAAIAVYRAFGGGPTLPKRED